MEIRQLQIFAQVAATKNFTKAGQDLGYSQSNISMQIQQLEGEIGAKLFDRIGHNITLTSYGEALLPYAQSVITTTDYMITLGKSNESMEGTIRCGVVQSIFDGITEELITGYHKAFPKVRNEITVDSSVSLENMLREGLLDFACIIADPVSKSEWQCPYYCRVPIVAVANNNHPLSQKPSCTLKDFAGEEFVLMEEIAPYITHFKHLLSTKDVELNSFLNLQSADMACRLVAKNSFLSLLPRYAVNPYVQNGEVVILPVSDCNISQSVQFIMHKNKLLTPQIDGFLKGFVNTFEALLYSYHN